MLLQQEQRTESPNRAEKENKKKHLSIYKILELMSNYANKT